MTGRGLALAALLAACAPGLPDESQEPVEQPYERRSDALEVRVSEGTEGVVEVRIRITEPGRTDLAALEARCRRDVATIARAEAARLRRPLPHVVAEAFTRTSASYEPDLRASRCVADTSVFGGENPLRPVVPPAADPAPNPTPARRAR